MERFLIEQDQIDRLTAVMKRLFSERRLSGDEMRDSAQPIEAVLRLVKESPWE